MNIFILKYRLSVSVSDWFSKSLTVTDLLWVTVCKREFGCDMKHDFSAMKGSEDCFPSCLAMTNVQPASEPEKNLWLCDAMPV